MATASATTLATSESIKAYVDANAGMSNPMTTAEDIIVAGASGTPARLSVGTEGQVLSVSSGSVAWAAAAGGGASDIELISSAVTTTETTASFTDLDTTTYSSFILAAEWTGAAGAGTFQLQVGQTEIATPTNADWQTGAVAYRDIRKYVTSTSTDSFAVGTGSTAEFGAANAVQAVIEFHDMAGNATSGSGPVMILNYASYSGTTYIANTATAWTLIAPDAGAGFSPTYDALRVVFGNQMAGTFYLFGRRAS